MRQALVVHDDRVAIPEIDGGQIFGENLLRLGVILAAAGLVGILGGVIEQRIEFRIRVMAAVGALG